MTCICRHRGKTEVQLQSTRNPALEVGGWSAPRPSRFTPGKDPVPTCSHRLGWHRGRSARVRKISPSLDFDPLTVQHIASWYTYYAIPAVKNQCLHINLQVLGIRHRFSYTYCIRRKQCGVLTSWQEVTPSHLTIRAWSICTVSRPMCLGICC